MRNLLLTIRFLGTAYHGWQIQENAVTVQEKLQSALKTVTGETPEIKGCSRTDTGVHASRFCVSVKTESRIPCDRLPIALNVNLPKDIGVLSCIEVPLDFHARYDAKGKRYVYKILNTPLRDPFHEGLALHYTRPIDENVLNDACKAYIGTHDFAAFCSSGSSVTDTVRTVFDATVHREGDIVFFTVSADGFLYNMVRIMVGTLLGITEGKISADDIPNIISSADRSRAGITAPPQGLYLDEVFYDI